VDQVANFFLENDGPFMMIVITMAFGVLCWRIIQAIDYMRNRKPDDDESL
jgi:hypothetical protein